METAADMIKRDIIPFLFPGGEYFRQIFAAYSDPDYQELSRRLVISKDWDDYFDMMYKVTSTGLFARIGTYPGHPIPLEDYKNWYRSSETITSLFGVHLTNKKWPLKKVL